MDTNYVFREADYAKHFTMEYQAEVDYEVVRHYVAELAQVHAQLVTEGWEEPISDTAIWARVYCSGSESWMRLYLEVQEGEPARINGLKLSSGADLDPAFGQIGEEQIGMLPWDPNTGRSTAGFSVELVDRTTGLSFEPPVIGQVDDKYEYVRLVVPVGQSEIAAKVTHSDCQVTYNYASSMVPGADYLRVAAYNKDAFSYYVDQVGLTLEAGKAQLWGLLSYDDLTPLWSIEGPIENTGIGCATLTSESLDRIYYTTPPFYLPIDTANVTSLQNSTFYAFNAELASITLSAQATGPPLAINAVPLAPDAITAVFMSFKPPIYPTNPTPANCQP